MTEHYRTFDTGATRDTDEGKLDYEGFLSPFVIKAFAEYMHTKRKMPDGSMRDSDNWQKGIPLDAYMKSMWRHFFDVWYSHREDVGDIETELLALLFNVMGYLHEKLKSKAWLEAAMKEPCGSGCGGPCDFCGPNAVEYRSSRSKPAVAYVDEGGNVNALGSAWFNYGV